METITDDGDLFARVRYCNAFAKLSVILVLLQFICKCCNREELDSSRRVWAGVHSIVFNNNAVKVKLTSAVIPFFSSPSSLQKEMIAVLVLPSQPCIFFHKN